MRPEAEGGILVTARDLEERLSQELTVTDWRAVVAVVVAAPGLEQEAEQACGRAMQAFGLGAQQVIQLAVGRDEASKQQLEAINRARDTLLPEKRLVWLRAASAADVRFLRKTAPDITSAIDVFVELRPDGEPSVDWPTCREQLRVLMEERHSVLDFTGLLPATMEQRRLPLAELYQPLVDLGAGASLDGSSNHSAGLLVLAHPGAGKTTFVRHLAWTYAGRASDPLGIGDKVPLLLSLSDYGYAREHDRVVDLVDFLPRWLEAQGVASASSLREHLPEVLLLLDGLDELRFVEVRRTVLFEASRLLSEGRVGGVVVTCRSFLVDEIGDARVALRTVTIEPPTKDQIRGFLTKFAELRHGAAAHATDLVQRVEKDADLLALAQTPLMLAFMAILDEIEGRLPDRRIEIYYRLSELLVDRWTRARSLGSVTHQRQRPTRADALRVLGPLAWWIVEQGGTVPEAELSREIERIEARRETTEEASRRAKTLLELLRADTALLVPHPGQRWSFVHKSVGEYFAAIEAERDSKRWDELLADPFRPEWREILLFCAGQLGVIEGRMERLDQLIEAILTSSSGSVRYDANYPSLIIALLRESPGLSRQQVDRLVERLLELALVSVTAPSGRDRNEVFFIQGELVGFLCSARGPLADSLSVSLRRLFSNFSHRIEWDRLMLSETLPFATTVKLGGNEPVSAVAMAVALGFFTGALCLGWLASHEIDLAPTLARWRQQPGWRYRLAEWLVAHASDEAAWFRPFAEVAHELGLEE